MGLGSSARTFVVLVVWIWRKGLPFASGDVFRASRLSAGNHLFPTQVQITPTSVVQYTARWIGKQEETIHMAHIASVKIDTGILLSNVLNGSQDPKEIFLNPLAWYEENGITLHAGKRVTRIDRVAKTVHAGDFAVFYDYLVFATGSKPFVPPIPGTKIGRAHV